MSNQFVENITLSNDTLESLIEEVLEEVIEQKLKDGMVITQEAIDILRREVFEEFSKRSPFNSSDNPPN